MASDRGWTGTYYRWDGSHVTNGAGIRTCPSCTVPTFFLEHEPQQRPAYGSAVSSLPDEIATLYAEARRAAGGSPTLAAAACRTILMHVAVEKGAEQGLKFFKYVDYLKEHGHVPSGASDWLDEIREFGNISAHEIAPLQPADAEDVIDFTAELLRAVYETPARGAAAKARREQRGAEQA